jgi:hypothetical protein
VLTKSTFAGNALLPAYLMFIKRFVSWFPHALARSADVYRLAQNIRTIKKEVLSLVRSGSALRPSLVDIGELVTIGIAEDGWPFEHAACAQILHRPSRS